MSWRHDNLEDMRHLCQSDEAPISERRDDQSLLAADELVLIKVISMWNMSYPFFVLQCCCWFVFAVLLNIITTRRQIPDRQMWRLWYWSPSSPRQVWSKTFRWEKLPVIIFLVSAIPGLLEPLKVRRRLDVDSNEHVEDVPLVHVHRDQRLELRPLHLRQVLHCLADQAVQDVQELVVRVAHYLMMFSWKTRAEVTKTKTNILMFPPSTFVFCIQKRML